MKAEMIENLETIVARFKRLETSLAEHVQTFTKHQCRLAEDSRALTLEVEQIKEAREFICSTVSETLKSALKAMAPQIVPLIVQGFEEKSKKMVQDNLEDLKQTRHQAHEVVSHANSVISSCKRELTVRRIWLGGAFWLGSMVSAGLIYYFFPQNIYQGYSDDFIKTYFVGKVVRDNFEELSPKDKALIQDKFNKVWSHY
jgi:hypothetical protein